VEMDQDGDGSKGGRKGKGGAGGIVMPRRQTEPCLQPRVRRNPSLTFGSACPMYVGDLPSSAAKMKQCWRGYAGPF
jgi:hypothetical protein